MTNTFLPYAEDADNTRLNRLEAVYAAVSERARGFVSREAVVEVLAAVDKDAVMQQACKDALEASRDPVRSSLGQRREGFGIVSFTGNLHGISVHVYRMDGGLLPDLQVDIEPVSPAPLTEAQQRVSEFAAAYAKRRGLDPEQVYSLGTADEPLVLRLSDLVALASPQVAPAPVPNGFVLMPVKLSDQMIEAALEGHYGKRPVREAGGARGISMRANGTDYSGEEAMRRMWKGLLSATPVQVAPTAPQAALLAELSDAVRAHFDLRDQIRARGMPPHPDFWHQALGEVETRLRNALDAVVEALK